MTQTDRFTFLRRHSTRIALSVLVAFAFWLILRGGGLPVIPKSESFKDVRWWTCLAYALLLAAWTFVRAMRTRHLLRPVAHVSTRQILAISWIGFCGIFVLPFRLGEIVRPALLHNKGSVTFATATATTTAKGQLI